MTDFAELVMTTDTRGLKKGEDALDDLVDAGDRAERQTQRQTDGMSGSWAGFGRMAGRALTGVVAAIGAYNVAASGLADARSFDAALAETSTLIEGTADEMKFLRDETRALANEFGTNATQQTQAFYQAISAGAADVQEAADIVAAANRLAQGGITDVATAVGVLSGTVNSYGKEAITVEQVSDALFVGMRAGVTTIDQLSSNIGMVIPLANAMGLSFDETVAATAALTKNNLTTSASVTALNAALTAISGPTKAASDLAEELGLDFSSAALQSKGFAAFMDDVAEKTGGNVDALRTLFGSVEGMKAALLLTGQAGEQFNDIMDDMANKAGQTQAAVDKVDGSLSDRLDDSLARLALLAADFGSALLVVAVPALEAVVVVAEFVADAVGYVIDTFDGFSSLINALPGPLGQVVTLVATSADYMTTLSENTDEADSALRRAEEGARLMNDQLNLFASTGAPSAGSAAINLANDNIKLAQSAYDAAAAELALHRATMTRVSAIQQGGPQYGEIDLTFIRDASAGQTQEFIDESMKQLEAAEAALERARADQRRAVSTVTGSTFGAVTVDIPDAPVIPPTPDGDDDSDDDSGGGGSSFNAQFEDRNDLMREAQRIMEGLMTEQDRYNEAIAQADRLLAAGVLSQEDYTAHVQQLGEELAAVEFGPMIDGLTRISDGMIDAIMNGDNLLDSFTNMLAQMALEAAKAQIGSLIAGMFGASMGGGAGIGILGLGFGGALARGGGADPSKAYLVGEDGPEIFRPDSFGTVIPNSQIGPMSSMMSQQGAPKVDVANNIRNIILQDPAIVGQYLATPEGEQAILNIVDARG